jgi:hypothetical protein
LGTALLQSIKNKPAAAIGECSLVTGCIPFLQLINYLIFSLVYSGVEDCQKGNSHVGKYHSAICAAQTLQNDFSHACTQCHNVEIESILILSQFAFP